MKHNSFFKKMSAVLIMSIFFCCGMLPTASAGEQPNLSNKHIEYNDASLAYALGYSYSGLWHETSMDGLSGVWYYGDESTMTYDVGNTSGTLDMTFSTANFIGGELILETKYETENSTYWDKCQILIGSDVVWERSKNISTDSYGNFGWETLSIDISSYVYDSEVTISFHFDTIDGAVNNYFGWALHNIQVVDPYSGSSSSGSGTTSGGSEGLTVSQVDLGNFPSVNILLSVNDEYGNFVSSLGSSNFTVKEAGNLISPVNVSLLQNAPLPLSLGLMVDQSGSMWGSMDDAKSAVVDFIDMSTGAQDQFGVVSIGSYASTAVNEVNVVQNFTTDKDALKNAVSLLSAEDMTPLYDGIAKALELTAQQSGIKAVIAFTDGDDTWSDTYTDQSVIDYAKSLGIPVYTIGIGWVNSTILEKIAYQTGGTYTEASDATELYSIYQALQGTIMEQYMLNFQSSLTTGDDACYDITATLPDGTQYNAFQCELVPSTPSISLTAETTALTTSGPAAGTDLTIGAYISDTDGDSIADASLFYRLKGSAGTFTKTTMEALDSMDPSLFTAAIPGSFYTADIEFYITASDGINTRTAPAQDYYEIIPGGGDPIAEQIYILGPQSNEVMTYDSAGINFMFTKINGAEKYVLHMELSDMLSGSGMVIPLYFDLIPGTAASIWSSGTQGTTGFTSNFLGMTFNLPLDTATWDLLSKYNFTWGVEAFDGSGNLIGSTYLNQVPEIYASDLKFISSTAIALTSPVPGTILSKQDAPPVFKWETYSGVSTYAFAAARIQNLGFDNIQVIDGLTFNLLSMDTATWSGMPSGEWFWTVFGYNSAGAQTPPDFTLFDFQIQ